MGPKNKGDWKEKMKRGIGINGRELSRGCKGLSFVWHGLVTLPSHLPCSFKWEVERPSFFTAFPWKNALIKDDLMAPLWSWDALLRDRLHLWHAQTELRPRRMSPWWQALCLFVWAEPAPTLWRNVQSLHQSTLPVYTSYWIWWSSALAWSLIQYP